MKIRRSLAQMCFVCGNINDTNTSWLSPGMFFGRKTFRIHSYLLMTELFPTLYICLYLRHIWQVLLTEAYKHAHKTQWGSSFTLLVFQKLNPNIEYYIRNNTNFIATKDGLILTNVMLHSPETAIMEVRQLSLWPWPGLWKEGRITRKE